jgi:hypothetical protein
LTERHDTSASWLLFAPEFGLDTIFQALPFHDSISVRLTPLAAWYEPTAVHDAVDTHATLLSASALVPPWMRLDRSTDQVFPFHNSTSGNVLNVELACQLPTATHAVAETHETPASVLAAVPRLGLGTIFHTLPFHDSTSVRKVPLVPGSPPPPTAMHHWAETHETALRVMYVCPKFGLGTTCHDRPFHDSTNVCSTPPVDTPTAMQALAETHEMPLSALALDGGFGVGWIDQADAGAAGTDAPAGAIPLNPIPLTRAPTIPIATYLYAARLEASSTTVDLQPSRRSIMCAPVAATHVSITPG